MSYWGSHLCSECAEHFYQEEILDFYMLCSVSTEIILYMYVCVCIYIYMFFFIFLNWSISLTDLQELNLPFLIQNILRYDVFDTQLLAPMLKYLPTMQETRVQSLGWEDLLERNGNHFSILAWKVPWTEEPGRLQSMGSQRVRHDWVTKK